MCLHVCVLPLEHLTILCSNAGDELLSSDSVREHFAGIALAVLRKFVWVLCDSFAVHICGSTAVFHSNKITQQNSGLKIYLNCTSEPQNIESSFKCSNAYFCFLSLFFQLFFMFVFTYKIETLALNNFLFITILKNFLSPLGCLKLFSTSTVK